MDIQIGDLSFNTAENTISCGQHTVRVEPRLCDLLFALSERPNQTVSREHIKSKLYGFGKNEVVENTITKAINRLRGILTSIGSKAEIKTVSLRGYELVVSGSKLETLTFTEKQSLAFRRVLDIAAQSRPDLVRLLLSE